VANVEICYIMFPTNANFGASYIILVLPLMLVLQKGVLISHLRHDMKNMRAGNEE